MFFRVYEIGNSGAVIVDSENIDQAIIAALQTMKHKVAYKDLRCEPVMCVPGSIFNSEFEVDATGKSLVRRNK